MATRLPTHLEIASLRRLAEANGGTAMVLARGERDAGAILIVAQERGENRRLLERMPQLDGTRRFIQSRKADVGTPGDFDEYISRRQGQDPDCWILEVDIADAERFIALLPQ